MKIIYSDKPLFFNDPVRLFLAGPTPRAKNVPSWRPEALAILARLGYKYTVFVPELSHGKTSFDYLNQVEWEYEGLSIANLIIFWIPRNLETLPGFTTNVEFGLWVQSGKMIYGRPEDAPATRYLDWLYTKSTRKHPHNNLESLLKEALDVVAKKQSVQQS